MVNSKTMVHPNVTLLNYGPDAKDTQLGMGLYTKDTAGHLEETDPVGNNAGLRQKSKVVELIGRLHTDICNQGRLTLNGLPI